MGKKDLSDEAALIVGFRVDKKSIRGWSQQSQRSNNEEANRAVDNTNQRGTKKFKNKNSPSVCGLRSLDSSSLLDKKEDGAVTNNSCVNGNSDNVVQPKINLSPEGRMEEWYKAQYFDYYFRSYKANGLDDATSSQYAHTCVSELEKSGYIKNAIQSQMGFNADSSLASTNFSGCQDNSKSSNNALMKKRRSTFSFNNDTNDQKLQNWICKLVSAYRSNGTSEEDIEWNKKLFCYSKHISERYKASNKSIDWDLQKLPKREVIQNFKITQEMEVEHTNKEFKKLGHQINDSVSSSYSNHSEPNDNTQSGTGDVQTLHPNFQSPNSKVRKRFTSRFESLSDGNKNEETTNKANSRLNEELNSPKTKKTKENGKKTRKLNVYINPCESESDNKPNDSHDDSYILDADGNKRLSWQQILALGRSTEKIVGLSTALEKPYLRLTASPDPNMVRPENILKKSLEFVLGNYLNYNFSSLSSSCKHLSDGAIKFNVKTERKKKYDWKYLEEQFRSIRQDLTVQGIRNNFTIQVYEMNGRIALENHDLGQFNQCQARLKELYSLNLVEFDHSNREEFLCYYIIYVTLQNMKTDIIKILDEVQPYKSRKGIKFALQISKSVMDGNYRRYFKLCKNAPWESRHLLDIFKNRQILIALTTMTKAFRFIEIPLITSSLGFNSNTECISFLKSQNAVFTDNYDVNSNSNVNIKSIKLDCKSSFPIFSSSPLLLNRKIQALG
ncbi:SAC3/GANP domain protein [Cryptosporidium ryanae]|uniref:SAC3/GANP domain protein n=1 Tax=Cryptosporidium ryanae TaxID=515981 RepID=UPI00351A845F|nr:SAC3/GANP domain protein [Cryptosporidium ryanae]